MHEAAQCIDGHWENIAGHGNAAIIMFLDMNDHYPDLCHMPSTIVMKSKVGCSEEQLNWRYTSNCLDELSAEKFMERIRGRTLSFLGDSLTAQQFRSLVC